MTKRGLFTCLFSLISLIYGGETFAQFYTAFSRLSGGNQVEEVTDMQVINGETYLLGTTRSNNFPATNGTTFRGNFDATLTKYNSNGAVVYATYIGGLGNDFVTAMKVVNNEVYISLYTDSINFPVTNGTTFKGRRDVVVVKINSSGNIAFATYLGGSGSETPAFGALEVINNQVIIAGTTASPEYPVTNGSAYHGGINDGFATILNSQDGSIIASTFWGGNKSDFVRAAVFDNNSVYLIGATFSQDIPTTIGSPINDTLENGFITRLSYNNLMPVYSRYLGGIKRDFIIDYILADGMLHLTGYTGSPDFPTTNGTVVSTQQNDTDDGFYTRLNADGHIIYSTLLTTPELDNPWQLIIDNGDAYIAGTSISTLNGQASALMHKVLANGNIAYSKRFRIGGTSTTSFRPKFNVEQGELYFSGISFSPEYPVTNGSQYFNGGTGYFTRLDPNGNIRFSTYLGSMTNMLPPLFQNGLYYLVGTTAQNSYPTTNGSIVSGGSDNILIMLQPDGSRIFSGYIGGSGNELPAQFRVQSSDVFISGRTLSANYPVTINEPNRGNGDAYLTKIVSCPTGYRFDQDTLTPKTQFVCKQGLGELIIGNDIVVPGDSLPILYRNGIAGLQNQIGSTYQWQVANAVTGPWNDIPGAVFRDYRPTVGFSDQFFRRITKSLPFCGSAFIHYSDTVQAKVNDLNAPVVDGGGTFFTCPGFPVSIGGNPTASGGNPPYISYVWDQGVAPEANPVVSPNSNTLYTVTVTDAEGCRQLGQSFVLTYAAAAGPDKGACAGTAASIGTPLLPGLSGLQYQWEPSSTLNNATIPQPLANPAITTDYVLTLTVPVSNGGTCQTTDTVRVTPVAAPVTANFAGPDRVFCLGSTVSLGLSPESGFNYVWSPGSYLVANTSSTTTYNAGNIIMPVPNPAIVNVTAQKSGCFFSDQTIVSTIEARAGLDGCGPRIVGEPDRTPNIDETYTWTKISGSGNFTGATNLPQVPVSASIGTATVYRLTVTYNGTSCSDDVIVPAGCSSCQTIIEVEAQYDCPSYSANGGNVSLVAFSSIQNARFSWSPLVGLSNYTGSVVQLTDNVPRQYTVTASDPNNSNISCSYSILVNDPSFVKPVFPAPDTVVCANQPVMIGLPPVVGYTYQWTGPGLSSNLISNPIATIANSTSYPITVTDASGCILRDTVLVITQNALVNAGPDKILCSSGIVSLGTQAQPNTQYVWEPQASPWQNNTNQFSAQPQVLVATDISFTVTATTSAGCVIHDTVQISINSNPSIPDAPDKTTCAGVPVRIGSPAIAGVTYQWTPATGLNNATLAEPLANPVVTTTYTLIATFPGACASVASDQVTVTVNSAFFDITDISFCPDNGPVALGTNAPAGMLSYLWSPAQQVTNANIANPSTLNPPPKTTSVYTLLVTNQNGCQYRDTIRLIPNITAPQAGPDRLICKGDNISIGAAANTTGPGISYNWSPANFLNDPNSPTPIFTASNGGVYTYIVTKTDANVNCQSKDTVIITVQDITFPVTNNTIVCANSCQSIGTTPVTGVQYQWFPAAGLSNPNIANPIACVGSQSVQYTLTASNLNGCSVSENILIGVNPIPAAQVTIPDIVACTGETGLQFNPIINPPGSYNFLWTPNDGSLNNTTIANPTILNTSLGIRQYQLRITDNVTGCSNTATGNLIVNNCSPLATIGDFLWFDQNNNGLQDPGEPGVSGMLVSLFNNAGVNVASTITNPSGLYYFTNVQPGNGYYVVFSLLNGYMFSPQLVGGPNSTINNKADATGRTNPFNVPVGASILNIDAGIWICGGGGPVPVTLLSFTGTAQNKEVMLYWQTTAEYQNDHFLVERSADGINFTSIGRLEGQGTSNLPHSYQLKDRQPLHGVNYYRLRQVDYDGRFAFSQIIAVKFDQPVNILAFYQPSTNDVNIKINRLQPETQVLLYGSNGQRMAIGKMPGNSTNFILALPVLSNGIYTLLLVNEGLYYTQQLLISH